MTRLRLGSVSLVIAGFFIASLASAQPPPAAPGGTAAAPAAAPGVELQEVTVSASAISIAGYQAPTPVTAVGIQQLESDARTDIGDAIRSLPAFAASPSPENSTYTGLVTAGIQGEDLVNLRNLGIARTLVLFDGQRVVQTNIQGGVDISTVPSVLTERIDNVTGGASATWGSDAMAGVVNIIINKNFTGVQANVGYSNNTQGLHPQEKVELALGTNFADDRGHIEVAGSWWNIPRPYFTSNVPGWQSQRLVANPACTDYDGETATCPQGQPIWLHANGVGLATATTGGLIVSCNTGTPGVKGTAYDCALNNTAFGLGGVPYKFNPGNITEGFYANGGTPNYEKGFIGMNAQPLTNETAFLLASFRVNDGLRASLQLNYGTTSTTNNSYTFDQYGNVPVYPDNPFLPASISSYMTTHGIPSVLLGTTNDNNIPGGGGSIGTQLQTISIPIAFVHRKMMRGVFTLDGAIGDSGNWTWNAYYMHGQSNMNEIAQNNTFKPNMVEAEDAVLGPDGVPTCRANLDPTKAQQYATPGCIPINIFGVGVASQQAIDYVDGPARNGADFQYATLLENVISGSIQGKLPFGLPAGPIAAAAGLTYRDEWGNQINCGFNCNHVLYSLMNFASFGPAGYNIKELNAEVNIPVLKDSFVRDLSIDLAGRASNYSTSGTVETYKFGIVSQLTDWVRFRGSYSYDIRAPNLFELFSSPTPIQANTTDPRTGQAVLFYSTTTGNKALDPEASDTKTFGLVFTPVQGMNVSIDYYDITINDVINSYGSGTEIAECKAGIAIFCNQLIFGTYPGGCSGPSLSSCPAGPLAAVLVAPVNADRETTSGLDVNGDYRFPLGGGALDVNAAMNYVFEQRYYSLISGQCDAANSIGPDEGLYCPINGVPKFRGNVAAVYSRGGWLATIQERMVGASHLVTAWRNGIDVDNNDIPFYWYTDLRLNYKFTNGLTLYGAVDNLMDKIMPTISPSANALTIFDSPYRDDIYDGFGRVYRAGLRWKF